MGLDGSAQPTFDPLLHAMVATASCQGRAIMALARC